MSSNWNVGHGHVWDRPDGVVAKCGGPGICRECADDDMRLREIKSTSPWSILDIVMLLRAKDLSAAIEREACAMIAEARAEVCLAAMAGPPESLPGVEVHTMNEALHIAGLIRARGN